MSHLGILKAKKSYSQEQTGSDRNRQDYISDIENYCTLKKIIYQIGNLEVWNRQEQTGTDRIRQEYTGLYI